MNNFAISQSSYLLHAISNFIILIKIFNKKMNQCSSKTKTLKSINIEMKYQCNQCCDQCVCYRKKAIQFLVQQLQKNQTQKSYMKKICLKQVLADYENQFKVQFSEQNDEIMECDVEVSTKFFFDQNGKQSKNLVLCIFCFQKFTSTRIKDHYVAKHKNFKPNVVKNQGKRSYKTHIVCPICEKQMYQWQWPLHVIKNHHYFNILSSIIERNENQVQTPQWYLKARQQTVRFQTKRSQLARTRSKHLKKMRIKRAISQMHKKIRQRTVVELDDPDNCSSSSNQSCDSIEKEVREYGKSYKPFIKHQNQRQIHYEIKTPLTKYQLQQKRFFQIKKKHFKAQINKLPEKQQMKMAFQYYVRLRRFQVGGTDNKIMLQWNSMSMTKKIELFNRISLNSIEIDSDEQQTIPHRQVILQKKLSERYPSFMEVVHVDEARRRKERDRLAMQQQQKWLNQRENELKRQRKLARRRQLYMHRKKRQQEKIQMDDQIAHARLNLILKRIQQGIRE